MNALISILRMVRTNLDGITISGSGNMAKLLQSCSALDNVIAQLEKAEREQAAEETKTTDA